MRNSDLNNWFFIFGDARVAAVIRIAFGTLLLFMLWDLYPIKDLLLSDNGINATFLQHLSQLDPKEAVNPFNPLYLLHFFNNPFSITIWFWISLIATFTFVFGIYPRTSLVLALILFFMSVYRAPYGSSGADKVLLLMAPWVFFLQTNPTRSSEKTIPLWPLRGMQIQLALIYLSAGAIKLSSPEWRDGTALHYALHYFPLNNVHFQWIRENPALTTLGTYLTLLFELSFPVAIFWKRTRKYWLFFGFLFHLSIDMLMQIRFFSLAMYVGYLSFIEPKFWEDSVNRIQLFLPGRKPAP